MELLRRYTQQINYATRIKARSNASTRAVQSSRQGYYVNS